MGILSDRSTSFRLIREHHGRGRGAAAGEFGCHPSGAGGHAALEADGRGRGRKPESHHLRRERHHAISWLGSRSGRSRHGRTLRNGIAGPAAVVQPQRRQRHAESAARTSEWRCRAQAPRCRCARAAGESVANGTCQNDRSGTSFSGSFSGTTEAGHSPSVAGQVVPAVRFYAKLGGQSSPVGPVTARVLAGFRR